MKEIIRPEVCRNCKYGRPVVIQIEGQEPHSVTECRRYPPTVVALEFNGALQPVPRWPFIAHDGWCGEFVVRLAALQ